MPDIRGPRIPASESLPRPTRIAVYDFAVAANDVSPNNAPLSRLRRAFGGSQTEEELKVGRSVADALSVDTAEADAKRTAEQLAKQIKEIFAARGWTAAKPAK